MANPQDSYHAVLIEDSEQCDRVENPRYESGRVVRRVFGDSFENGFEIRCHTLGEDNSIPIGHGLVFAVFLSHPCRKRIKVNALTAINLPFRLVDGFDVSVGVLRYPDRTYCEIAWSF